MDEDTTLTIMVSGKEKAGKSTALELIVAMLEAIGCKKVNDGAGKGADGAISEMVEIAVPAGALGRAIDDQHGAAFGEDLAELRDQQGAEPSPPTFAVGDPVVMRGTTWPSMTVRSVGGDLVTCHWFSTDGLMVSSNFNAWQLEAKPADPDAG